MWWRHGIGGVSLNEILRETGLSKSSLYREFGGADGLMAAALGRYEAMAIAPIHALLTSPLPPSASLAKVIAVSTAPSDRPVGCFFTKLRLARARLGEQTQAHLDAMLSTRLDSFAQWFEAAKAAGVAHPTLSAEEAARYLDNQLTAIQVLMATGEPGERVHAQAKLALGVLLRE
jgi:TetR/AcrR family transcriptional repressor of nem operon